MDREQGKEERKAGLGAMTKESGIERAGHGYQIDDIVSLKFPSFKKNEVVNSWRIARIRGGGWEADLDLENTKNPNITCSAEVNRVTLLREGRAGYENEESGPNPAFSWVIAIAAIAIFFALAAIAKQLLSKG